MVPFLQRQSAQKEGLWPLLFKNNSDLFFIKDIESDKFEHKQGLIQVYQLLRDFEAENYDDITRNITILFDPKNGRILAKSEDNSQGQLTSIQHSTIKMLEQFGQLSTLEPHKLGKREKDGYYVCLGLWVFSLNEPCIMCSMALTHSRIDSLFYINPHKSGWGGCNKQKQIFCDRRLNHKYKAYTLN